MKIGDTLWYVPNQRNGKPYQVAVSKVGWKWLTVGEAWQDLRINKNTMFADGRGYSSPGKCYPSQESYEAELALEKKWSSFRQVVERMYSRPADVTTEKISEAAELLGIEIEKKPFKFATEKNS